MGKTSVAKKVREQMDTLKPQTFEALGLTSTPRTEKVFDLVASMCMWSVVDMAHTIETVLPYLVDTMRSYMAGGAWGTLHGRKDDGPVITRHRVEGEPHTMARVVGMAEERWPHRRTTTWITKESPRRHVAVKFTGDIIEAAAETWLEAFDLVDVERRQRLVRSGEPSRYRP